MLTKTYKLVSRASEIHCGPAKIDFGWPDWPAREKVQHDPCCSVCSFKQRLDHYLSSIADLPCSPGYNNSLAGGDYLKRWTPRDDLVAG